jgi:tRNA pseudouridine55 synthase
MRILQEVIDLPIYTRHSIPTMVDGAAVLVDKPGGWSSFAVVKKLRWLLGVRKVGHAGTLDPMATGLLICLIGKGTKSVDHFMGLAKEYTGTIRLGQVTPSYDAETDVIEEKDPSGVTDDAIENARDSLTGTIRQTTPMYSAVKVGGERLYKKARRGEDIQRPPRIVEVHEFRITARRGADLDFLVRCSKGTYIRSIAHDLGQIVGVGAHLVALRRTAIGAYRVDDAWTVDGLQEALGRDQG